MVSRAIENAQKRVEGHHFDIRKHLIEYDDVMNQQRNAIYSLRRQILAGEDIERKVLDMLSDVTSGILDTFLPEDAKPGEVNVHGLVTAVNRQFGLQLDEGELKGKAVNQLADTVGAGVKEAYDAQKKEIGDFFEQLARMLMLQTIDQRWKEHLERIDRLKEGIHLRAHAQKDPLIEYKKEAFNAFQEMNAWIHEEAMEKLLKIKLVSQERAREVLQDRQELDESGFSYAGGEEDPVGFNSGPKGGLPFAEPSVSRPVARQQLTYGPPDDDEDGPKYNREQRRRLKKEKTKKLKV
jgi:preprotein translocase subunit SecA